MAWYEDPATFAVVVFTVFAACYLFYYIFRRVLRF